ncbi:MAG TPA: hypothetical protein VLT79_02820, partial [Gemmatimonadales bacterium]|nr:hypothetical protein [Gemmatimonadales bacterium]
MGDPNRQAHGAKDSRGSPAGGARASASALACWLVLAAFVPARVVAPVVPGMTWWSLDLHRFLTPAWAWIPWLFAAAALIPAVSSRLVRPLSAYGE